MKKTVYLHIGTHKTGTSAIQGFSANNSEYLLSEGFYYPDIPRPHIKGRGIGHHLLPWYVLDHAVPDRVYGEFSQKKESIFPSLISDIESTECDNVILSSEEFDRLNIEQIRQLKSYFENVDVKVVSYLRRKDSFLESMYQTDVVHHNLSETIEEYMEHDKLPLDYYEFIEKWRSVFGIENVKVSLYCKDTLKSNHVVIDFFNSLGLDVEHVVRKGAAKLVNASIPFQYVSVIAMLRRHNSSQEFIDLVTRISAKVGAHAGKNYHILTLEDRVRLAASGMEETERLNLKLPTEKCFVIPDHELDNGIYAGFLEQVFEDFEKYVDMSIPEVDFQSRHDA